MKKLILVLLIFLGSSLPVNADEELYTVSGFVTGCSSKHSIHVILYDEISFKDMTAIEESIYEPTGSEECKVCLLYTSPSPRD